MNCPVCNLLFAEPIPPYCSRCAWDLKNDLSLNTFLAPIPQKDFTDYQNRLDLARMNWQYLQNMKDDTKPKEQEFNSPPSFDDIKQVSGDKDSKITRQMPEKDPAEDNHPHYIETTTVDEISKIIISEDRCIEYKGTILNGKAHYGKVIKANGHVYEGNFLHGNLTGKGRYVWPNGDAYEGDWVNDKQKGKGKLTLSDGDVYEGDFVDGMWTGKGRYVCPDGFVYEGDYVNNECTGKGKKVYPDGAVYEGDFVNDNNTGKGRFVWPNGTVYEGDFVDGKMTGKGRRVWAEGDVYEGDFVDDIRTGKGRYIWPDGSVEEGDFVNGKLVSKWKKILNILLD